MHKKGKGRWNAEGFLTVSASFCSDNKSPQDWVASKAQGYHLTVGKVGGCEMGWGGRGRCGVVLLLESQEPGFPPCLFWPPETTLPVFPVQPTFL